MLCPGGTRPGDFLIPIKSPEAFMSYRRTRLAILLLCCGLVCVQPGVWLAGSPGQAAPASGADSSDLASAARAAVSLTNGTLHVPGLQAPVTVLRDRWGVPHIYARNQHDLFFAQGFVAAQDRLFQMELWKRVGEGRLAEVLGPNYLARDINARLLQYRGPMDAEYASYGPGTREILGAFTSGINAYIRRRLAPNGPGLPVEFRLAGFKPEPWKPEDCLTRLAGFPMTGNADRELFIAELVNVLGSQRTARLLDLDPPVALDPAPGLDFSGLTPELLRNLVGSDTRIELPPPRGSQGSNNWTISGKLTQSGKPLLANDPHRTIAVPSLRYIVHLVAPGWNVIGAGEPGLPGVAAGHNQHIAWGFTVFGLDQQDLYIEKLDPSNPLRYKTPTGWQRMRVEKQKFLVKGQPSVEVELIFTRHGPVLWEDAARHRALALRWVGAEPGTAGYLASLAVDRAENWQQFETAMARWKVPSENIVYADMAGNIGEHSAGLAPIRKNWTGLLPEPGDGNFEWAGFVPSSQLPHHYNPAPGFIATANHKMIPPHYPYAVGFEWESPYRFERISEVLGQAAREGQNLDVDDMARLQNDVVSLPAREFQGLLHAAEKGSQSNDAAVRTILDWDASVTCESHAAALYEAWLLILEKAVYHRLAPESVWMALQDEWSLPVVLRHLQHPDQETFGANPEAARDRMLLETLKQAEAKLRQLAGSDPATWGTLHRVFFHHTLDPLPGAAALTDFGPLPRPGDNTTVNAAYFLGFKFEQQWGASYRQIMNLADWDRSLAVDVPGESGQPASPHYGDLLPLWEEGKYFPLLYSRPAVAKQSPDKLVLEP
jgi:penicillin amidase